MPDSRSHRGPHPEDAKLFAPALLPPLRAATAELSWLLTRGYKQASSLKLVGDRHALTERQRAAISRCACGDGAANERRARALAPERVRGEALWIDGFNVLTTLEVALSGGVVLLGRDGALRDIAGVHGSYRRVSETARALELCASQLERLGVSTTRWLFDQPVSNSGRLAALMREHARANALAWEVELVPNPDPLLAASDAVVASADGAVLDAAARSFNLARFIVERAIPDAWLVDLSR
jgi:hypothetical protein